MKKQLKKLLQKKFRREEQQFIVEGVKGVGELLASSYSTVTVYIEEGREQDDAIAPIIASAYKKGVPVERLSVKDANQMSSTDTFPGVMAVAKIPLGKLPEGGPVLYLDGLKDPGNVGTLIRTADWFGVAGVILSEHCVDLYNPKLVRSTMGSLFHFPVHVDVEYQAFHQLKDAGYQCIGLSLDGEPLQTLPQGNVCLVLGSESHGLSKEVDSLVDTRYTIPGKGQAESLNVAIAGGIVMSQL
ncbi:RNA methyltransferase [Patescibacteria group bacterium]|nr:RNA methyltransferase [Patescibacteria group bacterium]MBU1721806.1 RNA methyltransferase [Patescibacteria group bacterium]MBU1900842.1 RNA methyltransferase [Patescibacteria group bacterium]